MHAESNRTPRPTTRKGQLGRGLYWVFAAIWLIGITIIVSSGSDIPVYMLIVATLFFLMLVPSMVELVQDYDRFVARLRGNPESPGNDSDPADFDD